MGYLLLTLVSAAPARADNGVHALATFDPAPNAAGWETAPTTVTLACDSGAVNCNIDYTIDGGSSAVYSAPFTISTDGTHTIVTTTHPSGDAGPTTDTFTVKIDQTAPTLTVTPTCASPGSNGWCQGSISVQVQASDSVSLSSLTCALNGASTPCSTSCESAGGCPITVSTEGNNTFAANATDSAGNSQLVSVSLPIDTQAPTTSASTTCASAGKAGWCLAAYTYALTASDAASGLATGSPTCTLDGASAPCSGTVTAEGAHTLALSAQDLAGHTSTASASLGVDLQAPTIVLSTSSESPALDDGWFRSAVTVTALTTDSGSGVALVEHAMDDGRTWSTGSSFTVPQGAHTIYGRVTDAAGRTTIATPITVRVDTATAPSVLDDYSAIRRPYDDPGITQVVFPFNAPMDETSTLAATTGADGWTHSWGTDDLWLNFTRTDATAGQTQSLTIGSTAQGRHGGTLGATTRSAVARAATNYSMIDSTRTGGPTYSYVNLTSTGTDTGIRCDDCGAGVPLPFPFTYYGDTYNSVYLASNGFLSFDNSCISEWNPEPLWWNGNCARDLIAGYWEDLDLRPNTGDKVLYQTIGDAPHRTFIASWNIVHHYSFSDPTVTFEIKLFEGTNDIEVHYERADSDGGQHLVGLVNKTGQRYLTYAWGDVGFDHRAVRFTTSSIGDTTAPTIDAHDDITAEATGTSGATVTYTSPATHDDADGTGTASCAPSSGSTFALGTTTVTCSATDAAGNRATSTFHVLVRDTTAPTIAAHDDISAEATAPAGAVVSYAAPATSDAVGGTGSATCAPASGSTFALGTTTVTCTASDAAGNSATPTTFHVLVRDTTAPTIDAKSDVSADETSGAGAAVTYSAPATHDAVDGTGSATCAPASGTTFAVGSTLVTCSATDAAGNHASSTTFHVVVRDATPPTITWSLAPASPDGLNGWYVTRPVLTASASDDQGVTAFENSSDAGATWSAFTSPYTYPEGTTTQVLRASDAAGNTATAAPDTIKVDLTAPSVTMKGDTTISGATATISFLFTEAMDHSSTESALTDADGWTRVWSDDSTNLTLTKEIPIGTSSLGIGTGAMDAHGQHLSAPASVVLTRRAPPPAPPPVAPPDAPSGLTYTLDPTLHAILSWSPPVFANGDPVSSYRVYVDDLPYAETGSLHFATDVLARGMHHTFRVTAVNSAGEGAAALITLDLLPVSTIDAPAPDANGWYTTLPRVTLAADPADAEIHFDAGDGDVLYSGPFDMPAGERTLTWYAAKGGLSETPHSQTFHVDVDEPTIQSASISPTFEITAFASDIGSGITLVEGILTPSAGGVAMRAPMVRGDDGAFHAAFDAPAPGTYVASVEAHDAAGHSATASAGSVTVAAPAPTPEAPTPPTTGTFPLESTSTGGGGGGFGGSGQQNAPAGPGSSSSSPSQGESGSTPPTPTPSAPPPPPPIITIHQPDDVGSSVDAGARGVITINVTGIDSPIGLSIVLIDSSGNETILAKDTFNASLDTTTIADGQYTIEVRRAATPAAQGQLSIQSTDEVLATLSFLVRNPPAAGVVAGAIATGVLVTGATQVGLSAAATASTSATASVGVGGSGFHATGFAQDVAVDAGQDTLRKKTKDALDRKRRIRSIEAAVSSLLVLASLWAFSSIQGWSFHDWLLALPIAGIAAALVMAMKYAAEGGLAWVTGAKPRIRLWIAGALSLSFSAIVFRNPFGYPGYVDETEESEAPDTWRKQGYRALATIAGAAAFMLPFLALAPIAPWAFVSAGLLMASTNAATSAMPFGPLPGKDVWRWNKLLAVVVALAGFGLYFAYAAAWIPMWGLWTIGIAGGTWYAIAFYRFREELRADREHAAHAVRIPVQTPVPVRDVDSEGEIKIQIKDEDGPGRIERENP